jgi:hypothetical protein
MDSSGHKLVASISLRIKQGGKVAMIDSGGCRCGNRGLGVIGDT